MASTCVHSCYGYNHQNYEVWFDECKQMRRTRAPSTSHLFFFKHILALGVSWKTTHQDPVALGVITSAEEPVPVNHHIFAQRATPEQVRLVKPDVEETEKCVAVEAVVSPGARVEHAVRRRGELHRDRHVLIHVPYVQHTIPASYSREDLDVTTSELICPHFEHGQGYAKILSVLGGGKEGPRRRVKGQHFDVHIFSKHLCLDITKKPPGY